MRLLIECEFTPEHAARLLDEGFVLATPEDVYLGVGPFEFSKQSSPNQLCLLAPEFGLEDFPLWIKPRIGFHFSRHNWTTICARYFPPMSIISKKFTPPSKARFGRQFAQIKHEFNQGALVKYVLSVFYRLEIRVNDAIRAHFLARSAAQTNAVYSYGFWHGNEGIFGMTPELLIRARGDRIQTMALAGTIRAAQGADQQLLGSSKDQLEHRLVVEDICQSLGPVAELEVQPIRVLKLPHLYHLLTPIHGCLRQASGRQAPELIARLHPTPALGGSPRRAASRWFMAHDQNPWRRRFGAPFAVSLGELDVIAIVAIRNLQWDDLGARIGVGCGIVEASRLDKEWEELELKFRFTESLLL